MAKEKLTAKIMADRKAGNIPNPETSRYGGGGHGRGAGSSQHGDDCGKCINCLDKKRVSVCVCGGGVDCALPADLLLRS